MSDSVLFVSSAGWPEQLREETQGEWMITRASRQLSHDERGPTRATCSTDLTFSPSASAGVRGDRSDQAAPVGLQQLLSDSRADVPPLVQEPDSAQ